MRHIIYIPGLGDHFDPLRRLVLTKWKQGHTRVTFVPMHWNNQHETHEDKYNRIAETIKQAKGDEIFLVGESAGGAMALLTFSRNPDTIHRVVTVCGYNHGAQDVHPYHSHKHPAFYTLMPLVDAAVELFDRTTLDRITTVYSTRDHIVSAKHSHIDGTKQKIIHMPGHFISIASILLGQPTF